jgi:ATP-binding cassette subfamily B multidrug efflux pump
VGLVLRLQGMSHWIMWEVAGLFENVGVVQDGLETIARERTVVDAPGAKPLAVSKGEIRFEHICFNYGRDQETGRGSVIEDLSLDIAPGEKVGLVGRSGAGKSTLVSLLLRFYDLDGGRILIDGQDIAHVTQDSLRALIGMVTQDTSLLHRTVLDNILYGRPDAGGEEAIAAARKAAAHEFIEELEDFKGRKGYDAHVGERGVKLSGGQRQRIAIARVLLKDAPILILDEATSALDSEVEAAIQEQLVNLMSGKTVIAIAHRLSTIAAMDRLVIMDEGRIIEQGSHAELLRRGGLYAELWARQSGGFLAQEAAE